jgi:hypothetical protein
MYICGKWYLLYFSVDCQQAWVEWNSFITHCQPNIKVINYILASFKLGLRTPQGWHRCCPCAQHNVYALPKDGTDVVPVHNIRSTHSPRMAQMLSLCTT